jgi:predicted dehydrogenase
MAEREALTRRDLLTLASQGLAVASAIGVAGAGSAAGGSPRETTAASQGESGGPVPPLELPPLSAATEQKEPPTPSPMPSDQRVGYAVVGLGHIALGQVIPGLIQSKRSRLAAVVSGSPEKAAVVARRYGVEPKNIYNYKNYEELRNNPAVQVVYIALPNALHAEYTIRGAQVGKHVFCEKPMATTSKDCERMIAACKAAGRRLMVGYRMQYEPYNREIIRRARAKELGDLKLITADNSQNEGDPTQWRLKRALSGGGALPDVGIYCLNATRYITGEEPLEVFARTFSTPGDPRFKEVEETMVFELRFPSGVLASCTCGYGNHRLQRYTVAGSLGWAELNPSFPYAGLRLRTARAEGKLERVTEEHLLDAGSQFAREIDHMSQCVTTGRQPHTPGEEGLADIRILEHLYVSAEAGHPMTLPPSHGLDVTRGPAPEEEG